MVDWPPFFSLQLREWGGKPISQGGSQQAPGGIPGRIRTFVRLGSSVVRNTRSAFSALPATLPCPPCRALAQLARLVSLSVSRLEVVSASVDLLVWARKWGGFMEEDAKSIY